MSNNVTSIHGGLPQGFDDGGGSGNDGGMEARLAALEAVVPTLATKADLGELRADMHEMNAGISRWMLQTVLAVIGTIVLGFMGLGYTMFNSIKQQPAPQAPAPIVITVPQPATPAASR